MDGVPCRDGSEPRTGMIRIYTYEKCDTCRTALKFLATHRIEAHVVPIREQPPSRAELKRMLALVGGDLRRLFNTSGQDYKALGLKDRLAKLSEADALNLLAKNGNLVKRPFALAKEGGVVGFKEDAWREFIRGA